MRHILSFFDEISCSITNSCNSSPQKSPSTVQKTVKRQAHNIVMYSNHKRNRKAEDGKSQEQTTSKKRTSASFAAMQRAAFGGGARDSSQNKVVTPAKGGIPVAALASILKNSQEKGSQQVSN